MPRWWRSTWRSCCRSREGTQELKTLALELLAAFEAREIHRESLAVLLLFQRA